MPKTNLVTQGVENKARIAEQHRAPHYARLAASRLVPFNWGGAPGMRSQDLHVFVKSAAALDHIIAVRATNEKSLIHIGKPQYVPKPFDCKVKTADKNQYVAGASGLIECGGLVVDPTVVGFSAFKDDKRMNDARKEWNDFLGWQTDSERKRKIFRRHDAKKGFFAIDTDTTSKHFGCMMVSDQEVPAREFSLHTAAWKEFKRINMSYIHSDYDLYGLIDVEKTQKARRDSRGRDNYSPARKDELLSGMRHYYTENFEQIKSHLNRELGVPMIQHGAQDSFKHIDDTLYVFYPDGSKYTVNALADAIRDIYERVFQQNVTT